MQPPWQLEVSVEPNRTVLSASGELDESTAEDLRAAVASVDTSRDVVLDLRGLSFMASAGIAVLIEATQTRTGRTIVVLSESSPAYRVLDLTGVTGVLTIAASPD
jgi:anti-sigma B factor antagonist